MSRIRESLRIAAGLGLLLATGHGFEPVARGQGAVAFVPQVGFVPNGATLSVTPAVSADRRYVRLSVNPYFNTVNGFTTYTSQLGAVGGGGAGGFGGGGAGGLGGGGGAGGFAGMNGVMGGGMGGGAPVGQMGIPYSGTYVAGDYSSAMASFPQGFGNGGFPAAGNGLDGMDGGFAGSDPFVPGQQEVSQTDEGLSPRATTPRSKTARQKAARKPARRPATTKAKTTRR